MARTRDERTAHGRPVAAAEEGHIDMNELIARIPAALAELDDEAIARVRAPLEQAWTLPTAAYTSAAIYDAEVERIMRRQWLPVARIEFLDSDSVAACTAASSSCAPSRGTTIAFTSWPSVR